MKTYSYTAIDATGKKIKNTMDAENTTDLVDKISAKGLFCTEYKEVKGGGGKTIKKFKTKDLAFNCRQMAAMMSSGLTLVKTLDILSKEQETPQAKQIWRDLYEDVQKGQSFSEALIARDGVFPDFLISMVSAGESSGSLDIVMQRMSDHYAKENKTNNKIKGSMMYPIILSILMVVVVIGLFTFIMPMFMEMFGDAEMPPLTKVMMSISDFLKGYWWLLAIIVVILVLVVKYALTIPSVRLSFDRIKLKGPAWGPLLTIIYTSRFARTMSSLYSSGIPMVECLEKSSAVLSNTYISQKFETVIDEVKQGEPLSLSVQRADVFSSMFCSIIYVGEESGALDDILNKTAEYYEDEADSAIERLVALMEPLIIIILGIVVGLIVASVLPALYGSMGNIM